MNNLIITIKRTKTYICNKNMDQLLALTEPEQELDLSSHGNKQNKVLVSDLLFC